MTTSQRTPFLAEVLDSSPIPESRLDYFRARLKMRLYSMIQNRFHALKKDKGFSKIDLARRLGRDPGQITRWMNSPGNLEVNTISDLLLAMRHEPILDTQDLEQGAIAPTQEAWLHRKPLAVPKVSDVQVLTKFSGVNNKVTEGFAENASRPGVSIFDVGGKSLSTVDTNVSIRSAFEKAQESGDQSKLVGLSVPAGALLQTNRPSIGIHV